MNTTPLEHRNTAHGLLETIHDDLTIVAHQLRQAGLPTMAGNIDATRAELDRWTELLALTPDDREQVRLARNARGEAHAEASIKQTLDTFCTCPGPTCPIHGDLPGVPT